MKWLFLITIVFLFIAAIDEGGRGGLPYGFFQLLRIVVSVSSVVIAVQVYDLIKSCNAIRYEWYPWVLGFLAIVFNPISPLRFPRSTWRVIDVIAGIVFIVCGILLRNLTNKKKTQRHNNETINY